MRQNQRVVPHRVRITWKEKQLIAAECSHRCVWRGKQEIEEICQWTKVTLRLDAVPSYNKSVLSTSFT